MCNWTPRKKAESTEKNIRSNISQAFSKISDSKPEMQEPQRLNTHTKPPNKHKHIIFQMLQNKDNLLFQPQHAKSLEILTPIHTRIKPLKNNDLS